MKHVLPLLVLLTLVLGVCGNGPMSQAQVPKTLSYQGILTDAAGTMVPDGNYSLTFKLYAASSGGTALWTETQSAAVTKGVFNVVLGSTTPIDLLFDKPYWLGMAVGAASEMAPRVPLTSGSYSMRSVRADTAGWLKVDFGATGSMSSATPLGNGPGWIFIAPNGQRRDIFAWNNGMSIDYKLYINSDGNVGVGTTSWPGGKLGVNGDIFVSGSVTKEYSSGTRNSAIPIAYGTVQSNGSLTSATPNVSCSWSSTDKWYEITITGENYFWADYITVVTAVPPTGPPVIASAGSVNNKLLVILQNTAGTNIQCMFSFVTYKP